MQVVGQQQVVVVVAEDKFQSALASVGEIHLEQKLDIQKTGMCCYMFTSVYVARDQSKVGPDGKENPNAKVLFIAKERSGCCTRLFYYPNHSFNMPVYFPGPGFTAQFPYKDGIGDPAYYISRPGKSPCFGLCSLCCCRKASGDKNLPCGCHELECCSAKPCIGGCACCDCCLQEMTMSQASNPAQTEAGLEAAKCTTDASWLPGVSPILTVRQAPCTQSMFRPDIEVRAAAQQVTEEPKLVFRGPCCFGGLKEWCSPMEFFAETPSKEGRGHGTRYGDFKKIIPMTCGDVCAQCCMDLNQYELKFLNNASPYDKVAMVTGAFLTNYQFFSGGLEIIKCSQAPLNPYCDCTTHINCFYCYCCGLTLPCRVSIPWTLPLGCCPGFGCSSLCS